MTIGQKNSEIALELQANNNDISNLLNYGGFLYEIHDHTQYSEGGA